MTPGWLYYNCEDPVAVLQEHCIRSSRIFGGVSLSESNSMISHGPFRITFRRSPWFNTLRPVLYEHRKGKNPIFKDEREWHSDKDIEFHEVDIDAVEFMTNAPLLHPIRASRHRRWLRENYAHRYSEVAVHDPKYHKEPT
jgi:hypothetical protein